MAKNIGPPGKTRERIRTLRAQGLTPRQIAAALGLSTQAVYQHIDRIKRDEERAS
jgi:DNA-binding CsgD family transcriptional regulator